MLDRANGKPETGSGEQTGRVERDAHSARSRASRNWPGSNPIGQDNRDRNSGGSQTGIPASGGIWGGRSPKVLRHRELEEQNHAENMIRGKSIPQKYHGIQPGISQARGAGKMRRGKSGGPRGFPLVSSAARIARPTLAFQPKTAGEMIWRGSHAQLPRTATSFCAWTHRLAERSRSMSDSTS
jgi:hypothetical protein